MAGGESLFRTNARAACNRESHRRGVRALQGRAGAPQGGGLRLDRPHRKAERLRNALRLAPTDKSDADAGLDQQIVAPPALLPQGDRGALDLLRRRDDVEYVVQESGLEKID